MTRYRRVCVRECVYTLATRLLVQAHTVVSEPAVLSLYLCYLGNKMLINGFILFLRWMLQPSVTQMRWLFCLILTELCDWTTRPRFHNVPCSSSAGSLSCKTLSVGCLVEARTASIREALLCQIEPSLQCSYLSKLEHSWLHCPFGSAAQYQGILMFLRKIHSL